MVRLLGKSKNGPIGLDLGSEGIRLLQLRQVGGRLSVAAAARWRYPSGADGAEADPDSRADLAAQAVRVLIREFGFQGRDAVSCLRGDELSVRNVRLPQMPDPELRKALLWESQERFGFEVAPDRMHYVNAGEVRQGSDVRNEILIMAATEQTIQRHLELLGRMKLRPLHLDTEPTALLRTYLRHLRRSEDESIVSVIVDVGLASTKVIVARGRTVLLIKSIDIAGRSLTQSVAAELGLSYSEAARLRRSPAQREEQAGPAEPSATSDQVANSVHDALRGQAASLAREIALCLRYCSVTFRGLRPNAITLAGGEAYDASLVKLLQEYLDLPCRVGEPLAGIDPGQVELGTSRRGPHAEWSVAAGLALRGLNETQELRDMDYAGSGLSA